MRVLIIEDELPAKVQLERLIVKNFPQLEIVGYVTSIVSALEWLRENSVDLIFTDVELSDGVCFEIFSRVETDADIIFTTAYDHYAIQAFKVNSVDYLMKPIDQDEFVAAVDKSIRNRQKRSLNLSAIQELFVPQYKKEYKKRYSIKLGDKIYIVNIDDIAYFYSEDKVTFLITQDGKRYISDFSLDQIEQQVNPEEFFRLSRGCIANIKAIRSVCKHFNSRLKVLLHPEYCKEVLISRIRVPEFMKWIDGSI